jgi:hypothetical protein
MIMQLSEVDVLSAISNEQSLDLFRTIALATGNGGVILITNTKLTRKQYYSRMSEMVKSVLIKRKNGRYFLTSLGKVVYEAKTIIQSALNDYWKLKAIDSLEASINDDYNTELPVEERSNIFDSLLIDNQKIKEIII